MAQRKNHHRGDSLAKKMARYRFYLRIRAWFGAELFKRLKFCYLASFEGGDASVLGAFGVPVENQLAVDFDAEALERFKARYPNVPSYLGGIEEIRNRQFDVVFVDLCSSLKNDTLRILAAASRLVRGHGSVFAYAVMRGREHKATMDKIMAARSIHTNGAPLEPIYARAADGRSLLIVEAIEKALKARQAVPLPIVKMSYQSVDPSEREAGKAGTPMLVHALAVTGSSSSREAAALKEKHQRDQEILYCACRKDHPRRSYIRAAAWARAVQAEGLTLAGSPAPGVDFKPGGDSVWWPNLLNIFSDNLGFFEDFTGFESNGYLAETAEDARTRGFDPAQALNLTPGRVAALLAHRTRGSYTDDHERWRKSAKDLIESEPLNQSIVRLCAG